MSHPPFLFIQGYKERNMETSCTYTGDTAYFSSDEKKWRNRIEKLAKEYPDEVVIIRHAEENDGCVYARFPASYLKIQPKSRRNISDEQRVILQERMRNLRREEQ